MLTGDKKNVGENVAKKLNIDEVENYINSKIKF